VSVAIFAPGWVQEKEADCGFASSDMFVELGDEGGAPAWRSSGLKHPLSHRCTHHELSAKPNDPQHALRMAQTLNPKS
jgi:hypothetical protein